SVGALKRMGENGNCRRRWIATAPRSSAEYLAESEGEARPDAGDLPDVAVYVIARSAATKQSRLSTRWDYGLLRSARNDDERYYAFTDGRSPTRANQAAMLALAGSSGWPTWPPKSSQQ